MCEIGIEMVERKPAKDQVGELPRFRKLENSQFSRSLLGGSEPVNFREPDFCGVDIGLVNATQDLYRVWVACRFYRRR